MEPEDWAWGLISGIVLIVFAAIIGSIGPRFYVIKGVLGGVGVPFVIISTMGVIYESYHEKRLPFRT